MKQLKETVVTPELLKDTNSRTAFVEHKTVLENELAKKHQMSKQSSMQLIN